MSTKFGADRADSQKYPSIDWRYISRQLELIGHLVL